MAVQSCGTNSNLRHCRQNAAAPVHAGNREENNVSDYVWTPASVKKRQLDIAIALGDGTGLVEQ